MKDAHPTIDRLLQGLRDAEPQRGIERRILEAMQAHETGAAPLWWRQSQTIPALAICLVTALAITGALVAVALHQHRSMPAGSSHAPTLAMRPDAGRQKTTVAGRRPIARVFSKHPQIVPIAPETQVASFPAPPLPLTEQERLLLRLAHRRNPEDTAILNPATQAAQSARANEQFQQFFGMNATEMRNQIE